MSKNKDAEPGIVRIILILAFIGGVAYCIRQFSVDTLTTRESTLLGIVLTIFSTAGGWFVTHYYANVERRSSIDEVQERNRENLRTYALKAAEKVNNLSNELNKLSSYLEDELSYTDYASVDEALSAKEERIESAIHMIRMLKSVNDTSLSDWKGVIGDELDQQREEQLEKAAEVQNVIEEMEELLERQRQGSQETANLTSEFRILRHDFRAALLELGLAAKIPTKVERKGKKEALQGKCPVCGSLVSTTLKLKDGSIKASVCGACGTKLVARYTEAQGLTLEVRMPVEESVTCPSCKAECRAELDVFPSATTITNCSQCNAALRLVRNPNSILVRDVSSDTKKYPKQNEPQKISDAIISLVTSKIPQQPWEPKMHMKVAQELGLPAALVTKVIQEQIRRKVFVPQVDGILYSPKEPDVTPPVPEQK